MSKRQTSDKVDNRPIIVKKIIVADGHGGHHGGAWKIAYADFVTAMMAFFLLMWLIGATEEKDRKAIADYFAPTIMDTKNGAAGGTGLFGGDSVISEKNYPKAGSNPASMAIITPRDSTGVAQEGGKDDRSRQQERFEQIKQELERRLEARSDMKDLARNVRFTDTREGLRIDLVDEADFSMFAISTDQLVPRARELMREVAVVITGMPNPVVVRGHTDAVPYASRKPMNNWLLSTARAEATRKSLVIGGVEPNRILRIEGVAEREPYNPGDRFDPRNRRMSITLVFTDPPRGSAIAPAAPAATTKP